MSSFKRIMMSASLNFRKMRTNWRVWLVGTVIMLLNVMNLSDLNRMCWDYGVKVTGWLFPLTINIELMLLVYGYCTVTFFSDAPFMDENAMLWMARTGHLEWLTGQMIYIVVVALILALFYALSPILAVLPNVTLENDWSDCIYLIVDENPEGYNMVMKFNENFLDDRTPWQAMASSILMLWLVNMLMGSTMLALNYISGAYVGTIVCGIMSFMSYFACFTGSMILGKIMFYISPVNWISLNYINWTGLTEMPPPMYGISFTLIGTIVAFSLSAYIFCKRDVNVRQGGILQ